MSVFFYICACIRFFLFLFFPPCSLLTSPIYQFDGCLSFRGCGGLWLGSQTFLAITAVSILELAAKSGSSKLSQAPNLHLAIQLLKGFNNVYICSKHPLKGLMSQLTLSALIVPLVDDTVKRQTILLKQGTPWKLTL